MCFRNLISTLFSFGRHNTKSTNQTAEELNYTNSKFPISSIYNIRIQYISILLSIELHTGKIVYMYGDENEYFSLVWISSKRLMEIWHPSQRDDHLTTRKKMPGAAACFAQSEEWPVPLANVSIGEYDIGKRSLKFNDGITRISWLIENGVKCIPLLCSHDCVDEFRMLAAMP